MDEKDRKCAHPACDCEVDEDTKYCSTYCEDAKNLTELSCGCGHAECGEREGAPSLKARG